MVSDIRDRGSPEIDAMEASINFGVIQNHDYYNELPFCLNRIHCVGSLHATSGIRTHDFSLTDRVLYQ